MYSHTQRFGILPGVILGAAALVFLVVTAFVPLMLVVFIPVVWIGWTFSTLTVTVGAETVEWAFRGGFWRKRVRLADLSEAKPVRNRWWYGWGVHLTPQGWLYNVGGLHAVQLRTKSGRRYRIGSDEPDVLAAEINRCMKGR